MFGGRAAGVEVTNYGGGVIENNEVFDNHFDGICLATGVTLSLSGKYTSHVLKNGTHDLSFSCLQAIESTVIARHWRMP